MRSPALRERREPTAPVGGTCERTDHAPRAYVANRPLEAVCTGVGSTRLSGKQASKRPEADLDEIEILGEVRLGEGPKVFVGPHRIVEPSRRDVDPDEHSERLQGLAQRTPRSMRRPAW